MWDSFWTFKNLTIGNVAVAILSVVIVAVVVQSAKAISKIYKDYKEWMKTNIDRATDDEFEAWIAVEAIKNKLGIQQLAIFLSFFGVIICFAETLVLKGPVIPNDPMANNVNLFVRIFIVTTTILTLLHMRSRHHLSEVLKSTKSKLRPGNKTDAH